MSERALRHRLHSSSLKAKRICYAALVVLVFYLPVCLIWAGVLPFSVAYVLLAGIVAAVAVYELRRGTTWRDLGFRADTLRASLLSNGAVTVVLAAALLGLSGAGLVHPRLGQSWSWFYVFYVLISSPFQEFLFRSVLFSEGRRAGIEPVVLVAVSAVTFCFLHVIWHDAITLVVALFMGLVWGAIYARHPNFWGVALSHAVLGALSIMVGLIG